MTGIEKDGPLTDLHALSAADLQVLRERQLRLTSNKAFIQRLPDKGVKIANLLARIDHVLATRTRIDDAAAMFEKMALRAETARQSEQVGNELAHLINTQHREKVVIEEDGGDQCVNAFQRVIQKSETTGTTGEKKAFYPFRTIHHKNLDSELVQMLTKPKVKAPSRFRKSGNLSTISEQADVKSDVPVGKDSSDNGDATSLSCETDASGRDDVDKKMDLDVTRMPKVDERVSMESEDSTVIKTPTSGHASLSPRLRYWYDESLSVRAQPDRRTQAVSLEESIALMKSQQRKHEEVNAEQAALRLAERLMSHAQPLPATPRPPLHPEASMAYREPEGAYREAEEESEADSDAGEEDYPD